MKKKKNKIEDYDEYEEYEEYENIEDASTIKGLEDYDEILYEDEESFDSIEDDAYDEESSSKKHIKNPQKITKIINVIFYILIILMIMITIDVISVSRYNSGPYFAIKSATYKDGGTKVYYGIGYKVIKYHQEQGRRDMAIGSWFMSYDTDPVEVDSLDLAIEYKKNIEKTYQKFNNKFLRITGTYKDYDKKSRKLTFGYQDPDNSYTIDIVCTLAKDAEEKEFKENQKITVIGTAKDFKPSTNKKPNTLYLSNCFAE